MDMILQNKIILGKNVRKSKNYYYESSQVTYLVYEYTVQKL